MHSTDTTTTASLRADEFWQPKTNITIIGQPADQVHGFDLSLDDTADAAIARLAAAAGGTARRLAAEPVPTP